MIKIDDPLKIDIWYKGWEESMLWSYFQKIMGEAYVNCIENPQSGIVYVNCFAFAAGKPDKELVQDWYDEKVDGFAIITARDDSWDDIFKAVGKDKCRRVERYAIKKEKDCFDIEQLNRFVEQLDAQYELKLIDEKIYNECKNYEWSIDFVHGYKNYDEYRKYGLGVVAFHGEEMAAGASSYSSYLGGIEVEIDTKEEYRRKGLATACGAKLILECLKRGLYPSWDAQNTWSVALAEKLGYHYSHTYIAYEIWK
ncbi:GNAT family N-acetyltransferase [Blautia schinkii]|nr:GNAT family N-acetyltransferase [Blautia schinkii]